MTRIVKSRLQLATTGAGIVNLDACLGAVCVNPGCIIHRIDQRAYRLGEFGFELF